MIINCLVVAILVAGSHVGAFTTVTSPRSMIRPSSGGGGIHLAFAHKSRIPREEYEILPESAPEGPGLALSIVSELKANAALL